MSEDSGGTGGELAMVGVVAGVGAGVLAVGWLSSRAACVVGGCTVRSPAPAAALRLLLAQEPARAWRAEGMSAGVFWFFFVALAGAALAGGLAVLARLPGRGGGLRPAGGRGLAGRAAVRRFYSARAVEARTWLRPDLAGPRARDLGVRIGRTPYGEVWITIEDSMFLSGPTRQGKTRLLLIPILLEWMGAALVTSVRTELVVRTLARRSQRGRPVAVFAPSTDVGALVGSHRLRRWSLTSRCEEQAVALRRARALVANAGTGGTENTSFWEASAQSALAPMLHAAAIGGVGVEELALWCSDEGRARGAVTVLRSRGGRSAAWADELEAQLSGDSRTVSNIWATLRSAVGLPLMDPAVRAALSPQQGDALDIEHFLEERGTLYVVGSSEDASAPIVGALVEEVYAVACERANRSEGNRCCPPLGLILDEINHVAKLPSLPAIMAAGGGSGVWAVVVEQSRAQSEARWGAQTASAVWDSAAVKVLLGGITREATLTEVSTALGDRLVNRRTTQVGRGPASTSLTEYKDATASKGQIHSLPYGQALVLKAGAPALVMSCLPDARAGGARGLARAWLARRLAHARGGGARGRGREGRPATRGPQEGAGRWR